MTNTELLTIGASVIAGAVWMLLVIISSKLSATLQTLREIYLLMLRRSAMLSASQADDYEDHGWLLDEPPPDEALPTAECSGCSATVTAWVLCGGEPLCQLCHYEGTDHGWPVGPTVCR